MNENVKIFSAICMACSEKFKIQDVSPIEMHSKPRAFDACVSVLLDQSEKTCKFGRKPVEVLFGFKQSRSHSQAIYRLAS